MRMNLRHNYCAGRHWESEAERERYIDTFEAARVSARERGIRYVIAPEQFLTTHDGRRLEAGDEVVPARDFVFVEKVDQHGGSSVTLPTWRQLERLVFDGRIIDSGEPEPPRAA